jgi:hypothetical protein
MTVMQCTRDRDRYRYRYHEDGTLPNDSGAVFVFGSNERGIHGAGAALVAAQRFGAPRGPAGARGPLGPGIRCYAIATKDASIKRALALETITPQVRAFVEFAQSNPERLMWVTRVGCGLAGYADAEIAPLFRQAPPNCSFALPWRPYLEDEGFV